MPNGDSNTRNRRATNVILTVFKYVAIPLAISMFCILMWQLVQGPDKYYIYVIGNFRDDPNMPRIFAGLETEWGKDKSLQGTTVEISKKDDKGDLNEVEKIAREYAQRRDVLMVVGHCNSSMSKRALPVYLTQDPMIPVILVTETNPDLIPNLCSRRGVDCPVFQLSPTDEAQASRAVEFAIQKGCTSFLVVKDSDNPVYSNYLANEYVRQIHKNGKSAVLLTLDTTVFHPKTLEALDVDCVLFAGEYDKALILVSQIKRAYTTIDRPLPIFILSDWSANQQFPQIGTDIEVYLTHPRTADEITSNNSGYRDYGRDTASIIKRLVDHANQEQPSRFATLKKRLKIRSIADARASIALAMKNLREFSGTPSETTYKFGFDSETDNHVKGDGHLIGQQFHVWKVEAGKFLEVRQLAKNESVSERLNDPSPGSSHEYSNPAISDFNQPDLSCD